VNGEAKVKPAPLREATPQGGGGGIVIGLAERPASEGGLYKGWPGAYQVSENVPSGAYEKLPTMKTIVRYV
jgi:hypothetical protein